jgi:hypothetical protein
MASNSSFGAGGESKCTSQNFGLQVSTKYRSIGIVYDLIFDAPYFDTQ